MTSAAIHTSNRESGVTIIEVLASALLIFLGLGGIFAMNTQSLEILRSTRLLANGSQVLQERLESFRNHQWPEVANSQALADLFAAPTPSEQELGGAELVESIVVSIPETPGSPKPDNSSFSLRRRRGIVQVVQAGDLTAQPLLLVDIKLTWKERQNTKERELKTIVGRTGLTRSGIFGSAFGRPETANSGTVAR
jgi:hypothetical protein